MPLLQSHVRSVLRIPGFNGRTHKNLGEPGADIGLGILMFPSSKSNSSSENESGYARLDEGLCQHQLRRLTKGRDAPQRQLPRLGVLEAHPLPVEKVAEALGAVALVDALATGLLAELHHLVRELIDRVLDRLCAAVDDVDAVVFRVLDELL